MNEWLNDKKKRTRGRNIWINGWIKGMNKKWNNEKNKRFNKGTKEQMHEWMNEWMNVGEGGVSRQGLKGISNVHGKLLSKMVRVFFPPNWWDDYCVPTWMMGVWFSQHPTYSGFPSQLWLLESMFGHNQHPTIKYDPSYWRQLVPVLIAQWRSGFFGAVENAAFWTWCLFFSSLFISLSGEKACKLQPCSILKK